MYDSTGSILAIGGLGTGGVLALTGVGILWVLLAAFAFVAVGAAVLRMVPRREK